MKNMVKTYNNIVKTENVPVCFDGYNHAMKTKRTGKGFTA